MNNLFINYSSYLFLLNSLFRRFLPDAGTGELTDAARLAAYFNTYRNTLADLTDVRDHADQFSLTAKPREHPECRVEGVLVKRAEALVQKERIHPD